MLPSVHTSAYAPRVTHPHDPALEAPDTGRRAANKERTRVAIVDAAVALVGAKGLAHVTAQDVADAADISRRTFFNYYSSVEAVLADKATRLLGHLAAALAERTLEEPLFVSFDAVMADWLDLDHLRPVAIVWGTALGDVPTARHVAYQLQQSGAALVEVLHHRSVQRGVAPDDLAIGTLAGALTSAFATAQSTWYSRTGGEVSRASFALLSDLIRTAIGHLADGFTTLDHIAAPGTDVPSPLDEGA